MGEGGGARPAQPSPNRHAIVGFFNLAIAWIILPSSHAAPAVYPLLDSVATTLLSSYWRITCHLPSSSPLHPLVACRELSPSKVVSPVCNTRLPLLCTCGPVAASHKGGIFGSDEQSRAEANLFASESCQSESFCIRVVPKLLPIYVCRTCRYM